MKAILRILLMIGILWSLGLVWRLTIQPAFLLDAVVPPRLLKDTSLEERQEITHHLRRVSRPSAVSWMGALAIVGLSGAALRLTART